MKTTKQKKLESFLKQLDTDIDILNYVDIESIETFEDMWEQINDNNGFDIEIIYYDSAMDYLKENDNSLQESFRIASDMGFELSSLNSETLASLLASENARDDFYKLQQEVEDFLEELS